MLWLALHFSSLPLEVFARAARRTAPLAVISTSGQQVDVVACNEAARVAGVRPGMAAAAASALAADLTVVERDAAAERAALERIAAWAIQFTPAVSIAAPSEVLLEIEGSLKIFDGLNALWKALASGLKALGFHAEMACAPTPLAAQWFARAGLEVRLRHANAIEVALAQLRIERVGFSDEAFEFLANIGVRTVSEILKLPRSGLARRLGQRFLDDLDRVLTKLPDPRVFYTPPTVFKASQPLPAPAHEAEMLVFAARRLLTELCGYLTATARGAQQVVFTFVHYDHAPTRITIALVAASRDLDHLTNVLRERLERIELPCPALEVALETELLLPLASKDLSFLPDARQHEEAAAQLIERLRARLGEQAVLGLKRFPDHRPEHAWQACAPGANDAAQTHANAGRPLWLLSQPQPLDERSAAPCYDGRLTLISGPERIESGWWDGNDVARDYFVAANPEDMLVWVYRDRRAGRWFLHGFFA